MSTTPPKKTVAKAATKPPAAKDAGEKKARAPKQDYGYAADAKITVAKGDDVPKFRGQRLEWFEKIQKFDGKTAKEFLDANQGKDSPRGWLRFFCSVNAVTLSGGTKAADTKAA